MFKLRNLGNPQKHTQVRPVNQIRTAPSSVDVQLQRLTSQVAVIPQLLNRISELESKLAVTTTIKQNVEVGAPMIVDDKLMALKANLKKNRV
jgi:hypothetical protein